MARKWMAVFVLFSLFMPAAALAEIYYWIDDQGTEYYTTSFESIPEAYRSSARLLPTPTSPPAPPELQAIPSQKNSTKIRFTSGSPVLVSAKINGAGPITLILDTGSDRTLIIPSVLQRFGISIENVPRTVIKGVTGMSDADAVWVHSVEVGEAKVGPLLVIAHDADLNGADGLLGRDFLAHFNVTIDSKERVVTFTPN